MFSRLWYYVFVACFWYYYVGLIDRLSCYFDYLNLVEGVWVDCDVIFLGLFILI